MRIALVVPGGVGADGVHEVIPALLSLIERLAVRHDMLVIAMDQVASPSRYELRGATIVTLGRRRRGAIGRLLAARRATSLMAVHRPDVIHAIWLGLGSTAAILAGRSLRAPVVASVGGGELVSLSRIRYGGARSVRGRWHVRLALDRAAAVTAGSRAALEPLVHRRLDARWLPLGAERVVDDPPPRVLDRHPDDPVRLLVVGSVNRVKGPEVVLGALARARAQLGGRVSLAWIGEDTLGGSSAALARALGLADAVAFRGFRPHDQVLGAFQRADLAIQGSHHESQGVALLEAAMAGVPTIGTSVGLVPELASVDPPAALAVPVGDPGALGDAIVDLVRDPERRIHLGGAAREWALAHDADWTAASFEALYAELTARHRA
jgi:glycosyltransferase involved in cell wall biosynthesis